VYFIRLIENDKFLLGYAKISGFIDNPNFEIKRQLKNIKPTISLLTKSQIK